MKKRKLFFLTLACLTAASSLFALTSCEDKPEEGQGGKDPVEHTHVIEIVAGKEATCTETGLTEGQKCSECGETIKAQEVISAMGHAWNDGEVTTQATCTAEGVITYTCANCGETKTESVEKIAHNVVEVPAVKATCFETGLTAGEKCSVCGEILKEQEVVPTTTHNYVVTTDVAPTCTESGYVVYRCENCGDSYSVSSPAVGHNYVDGVCTVCGDKAFSKGLKYTLSSDKTSYTVSGIGTCTDTDIVIPSEYNGLPVTSIGDEAFDGCSSFTNVMIPDSVTSIGKYSFQNCTNITSITIPKGVTTIEYSAFSNCFSLTSIAIPEGVTSIGGYAFGNCISLTSINVDEKNANYQSIDGVLFTKDGKTLIAYPIGNERVAYSIPEGVTQIGVNAFACSSLTSITISEGVANIGDFAFVWCSSLTSVTIPDSVTSIGGCVFAVCSSLTSIAIPKGVTTIAGTTFADCSSLTSIAIPEGVTSIESYAFDGCNSLTTVNYAGSEEDWGKITIESNNTSLTKATIVYNYQGE